MLYLSFLVKYGFLGKELINALQCNNDIEIIKLLIEKGADEARIHVFKYFR